MTDREVFLSDQSITLKQLLEQCGHHLIASADDENQRESLVSTRGQLKRQRQVSAGGTPQRQNKRVTFRQPIDDKTEYSPADNKLVHKLTATDVAPIAYISATRIQGALPQRSFTVLLDSGSSHTLIKLTSLPFGVIPNKDRAKSTTGG